MQNQVNRFFFLTIDLNIYEMAESDRIVDSRNVNDEWELRKFATLRQTATFSLLITVNGTILNSCLKQILHMQLNHFIYLTILEQMRLNNSSR